MKGSYVLLFLAVLLRSALFGQYALFSPKLPFTYVFKLDSADVAQHYLHDSLPVFRHKLDSFTGMRPKLAPGMYALVTYREPRLEYEIVAVPFARPVVNAFNGRVELMMLDSAFRQLQDVAFDLEGRRIPFDSTCRCYPFERSKKKRFFYLKRGEAFLMGFVTGDKPAIPPVPRSVPAARPVVSYGYFLLNQPKYQPADSVKMKAYVLNASGKAYTSSMKLYLIPEYQRDKPILLANLKPVSRGAYVYQFKLADTLKLDQKYTLELENMWGDRLQTSHFYIEAYKLRNSSYSAQLERDKLYQKEQIRFRVSARDANGLPLTDARVKLRLKLVSYNDFYDSIQFIPSEWYTSLLERNQELEISSQTEMLIPVDSLPAMDMQLKAELSFSNAAGELRKDEFMLSIVQKDRYASLTLEEEQLNAVYIVHGKSRLCKAILNGFLNGSLLLSDTVMLPFQGPFYQNCDAYQLRDTLGNLLANLNLPRMDLQSLVVGKRSHDSIFIQSNNPAQLEFQYRIYKDDKLVKWGSTRNLNYVLCDTSAASYNVFHSLIYRGHNWMYESVYSFKEQELIVKTNLPAQIYPGQTIPLDIQVQDAFRKPVAYANLTVFGVNAQFEDFDIPELKSFSREKGKLLATENTRLIYWPEFTRIPGIYNPSYTLLLKSGLITEGDYRLRYPNELFIQERVALQKNQVEVIPILTGNGKRIPFYSVELDGVPLLVEGENKRSNALLIPVGKHQLSIRTRSAIYTLPVLDFKDSSRYVLAFDTLCLPGGIRKQACANQQGWSKEELLKIRKHMLVLDVTSGASIAEGFYVVQRNRMARIIEPVYREKDWPAPKKLIYLGLFEEDSMELVLNGKPIQKLRFVSGNTYVLFNNRLVIENQLPDSLEYGFRFFKTNDQSFNSLYDTFNLAPYTQPFSFTLEQLGFQKKFPPADEACLIKAQFVPKAVPNPQLVQVDVKGMTRAELSHILFFNKEDKLESLLNPEIIPSYSLQSFMLKPGIYDFYFISAYNSVYKLKSLPILANGKTCIALDSLYFTQPCKVLDEVRELSRQLHTEYQLRESMQVSYRKEDYVEVREKIPVQMAASEERTPVVSGFVFDEKGIALEHVIITLEQHGKVKGISFSDKTGSFIVRDIDAGNYQMRLTRYGSCITLVNSIQLQKNRLHSYSLRLNKCGFDGLSGPGVYFGKRVMTELDKSRTNPPQNPGNASEQEGSVYMNGTGMLKGRVVDLSTKAPLDYVTITLSLHGVKVQAGISDEEGEFLFRNLTPGEYTLQANFVGYSPAVIRGIVIERDFVRHVNFTMQVSDRQLQEVVIVQKKDLVERGGVHVQRFTSSEIIAAPARNVNGIASLSYGVESRSGLLPATRGSRAEGTAYYIDGVRVSEKGNVPQNAIGTPDKFQANFSAKEERQRMLQMASNTQVKNSRNVFRDYAFWVPNLVTNKQGEAHVSITFPDNITRWDTWILAMNEHFQSGMNSWQVRAYKPLAASLYIPSFAIHKDQIHIKGKLSNYTGEELDVQTYFSWADSLIKSDTVRIQKGHTESVRVDVPNADTLSLKYGLKADGNYADAESFLLPVLPAGIETNVFQQKLLAQDSVWSITTGDSGTYELRVVHGYSQLLREEIGRLRNYQYGCVEQTTSKMNALLVEKALCRLLNDSFADENLIRTCIRKLEAQQSGNGSFGWFSSSSPETWLTFYVLKSLQEAAKQGYETRVLNRGLEYFRSNLHRFQGTDKLRALYVLAEAREPLNYEELLNSFNEEAMVLLDRLLITAIKQKLGLPHFSGFLYERIAKNAEGGIYWNLPYESMFQNRNTFGPMAYDVLKKDGADSAFLAGMRMYFFNERNFSAYLQRNTLESAMVLQAMAKDMAASENAKFLPVLSLNGNALGNKFPVRVKLQTNSTYKLANSGAKAQALVSNKVFVEKPACDSSSFGIKTVFVQDGKQVTQPKSDIELEYRIELSSKKNQEFLLVQIPIPASCTYSVKGNPFGADEVEYKKDRVLLYFRRMRAGKKQLVIRLEPRFKGSFTLLPVQVENMYDAQIKGNNETRKLLIE